MPTQDIDTFVRIGGESCVVFNGPDEQFVSGRAIGAAGGIGGTYGAMPELYIRIFRLFHEGKMEEAREIQNECCRIIYEMCSAQGNLYAVLKEVIRLNGGPDAGDVRNPLFHLQESDKPIAASCAKKISEMIAKYC